MLELVHRIGNQFGISIVVCSHLLGEVERICDSLIAIDAGRLLRSATVSDMTTERDVLTVEVSEGVELLAKRLAEIGLTAERDGQALVVNLEDEDVYDRILVAVAELDLPLHRLDQRRHRVAELFQTEEVGHRVH
jgi:ABC-2 type transport system ATP-binding protein